MTAIFVVHLIAFRVARSVEVGQSSILAVTWTVAILSRLILLPSHPIQEVDLYRYLWDGQVTVAGVSPFRFAPATVIDAMQRPSSDGQLAALADMADQHAPLSTILKRVHFGELPTVYPPVSQCVFAAVAAIVAKDASVHTHVVAMKFAIVCFDLGILSVLVWLLRMTELNPAWAITYAWNPLVLKEFAGSGHLDSIAVFFTVISVAFAIKAIKAKSRQSWLIASLFLALGFGAKLYPIILVPVLLVACYRAAGFAHATKTACLFFIAAVLCVLPVALTKNSTAQNQPAEVTIDQQDPIFDPLEPPLPDDVAVQPSPISIASSNPTDGIATFLSRWEMNDLVFLVVIENLRPASDPAWFCVTPDSFRSAVIGRVAGVLGVDDVHATFLLARVVTVLMFVAAGLWLILQMPAGDPKAYGRTAFLVIALFWMLSPTLNPWYWTWALPLICFARSRGWLLVSGMLSLYYLRFWFLYHEDHWVTDYLPYSGTATFDFFIVFLEHLSWMLAVLVGVMLARRRP